ncbi:MAG: AAA family ATPase [Chloroflexota bacterium]|nr:AAA family ATPase [Chloroflexota bacterium]
MRANPRIDQTTATAAEPVAPTFGGGRYVVQRLLGEGGQKRVYLVHDTALERESALALFKGDGLDEQGCERISREARAMGRLGSHPNLVTVFDIGEETGLPYIVCEYVGGGDLRRELRAVGGPLGLERTLQIGMDLASALTVAHQQGIVHRDIKPGNVWLAEDGRAKLGDFGLAAAADRSRLTQTGSVLGTAAYMAPEQAVGGEVDHRSDLYALGAVLYELVTGRPPFLGDDPLSVLSQHLNTAPVAPSWHNGAVPAELETLIERLLAKVPDDRPQTAGAVLLELQRVNDALSAGSAVPSEQAQRGDLRGVDWGRFVGRREELDQLRHALDEAFSERGSVALIAGEPGIGKTRLAQEFAVYARLKGAQVLTGRCDEGGASLPYRPFVEALRQYVRRRPDTEVRSELGTGAPEIAALVSDIRQRFPDLPEPPKLEGDAERLRLFDSITQFLRNASAAAPLALFLDDLHWADKSSLLLLRHLAREVSSDRVLLLGTYRDVELVPTHPLVDAIAALRREPSHQRVLLRGLPEVDVVELLATLEPSEEAAAVREALAVMLFRETDGNPFFIREVLSHLVEEGKIYRTGGRWTSDATSMTQLGIPEGVREVIGRRLSRLSEGCQKLLTTSSAMTGGFSWLVLQAVTGEDEATVLDLLDEALAAQLIAERKTDQSGTFDFTHALIRHTLYDGLTRPRRMLLHQRIAEALERVYAANIDAHVAELADHFYRAAHGGRGIDRAIEYARRAALRAIGQYAYDEAIAQYERALELLELTDAPDERVQAELLLALADQFWNAGEFAKVRANVTQACGIASRIRAVDLMAQGAIAYSSSDAVAFALGSVDLTELGLLESALASVGETNDGIKARLMGRLAERLAFTDQHERRRALARDAIALARIVSDSTTLWYVMTGALVALREPACLQERLDLLAAIQTSARELNDAKMTWVSDLLYAVELLEVGEIDLVRRHFANLAGWVERTRRKYEAWMLMCWRVDEALFEGRFDDADRESQLGLAAGVSDQNQNAVGAYGAQLFFLRREQDRLAEVLMPFQSFIEQYPLVRAWRCGLALLHAETGNLDAAREEFERLAVHDFDDFPPDLVWMLSICVLSEVAHYLRDAVRADKLAALLAPYPERNVNATSLGPCLGSSTTYLALCEATAGHWDEAQRHFEAATAHNQRMGMPVFVARTQLAFAEMLVARRAPGDCEQALTLLDDVLTTASSLGMVKVAGRAMALRESTATPA